MTRLDIIALGIIVWLLLVGFFICLTQAASLTDRKGEDQ